jgi:hypothetical protein
MGVVLDPQTCSIPLQLAPGARCCGVLSTESRTALQLENVALRHQITILQRSVKRPRLKACDRLVWVWLSRIWSDWRSSLVIVKPETVIRWHRQLFRMFWTGKIRRGKKGRPVMSTNSNTLKAIADGLCS